MSSRFDQLRTQVFRSQLSSASRSIRWALCIDTLELFFFIIDLHTSHIDYEIVDVDEKNYIFAVWTSLHIFYISHIDFTRLWTWTRRTRSWRQIVGSLKSGTTLTSLGTSQVVRISHRFVNVYICWYIWQIFRTSSIQILVEWGIFGYPFRRSGGQMWYFTTSELHILMVQFGLSGLREVFRFTGSIFYF